MVLHLNKNNQQWRTSITITAVGLCACICWCNYVWKWATATNHVRDVIKWDYCRPSTIPRSPVTFGEWNCLGKVPRSFWRTLDSIVTALLRLVCRQFMFKVLAHCFVSTKHVWINMNNAQRRLALFNINQNTATTSARRRPGRHRDCFRKAIACFLAVDGVVPSPSTTSGRRRKIIHDDRLQTEITSIYNVFAHRKRNFFRSVFTLWHCYSIVATSLSPARRSAVHQIALHLNLPLHGL